MALAPIALEEHVSLFRLCGGGDVDRECLVEVTINAGQHARPPLKCERKAVRATLVRASALMSITLASGVE